MSRSKEVETVVGEGETLEQQAARLRQIVQQPTEQQKAAAELAAVERQMAERREAEGQQAAQARLVEIKSAFGGLTQARRDAVKRVQKKRDELADAIKTLNKQIEDQENRLRPEADALADRFGIAISPLKSERSELELDLTLPAITERRYVQPTTELCPQGMRRRRTFAEVAGTEAGAILARSGLKAWPPLTSQQQEIVDAHADQHKHRERQADFLAGEAAALAAER